MLLPLLRYREPKVAIAWLGKAFGFGTRCVATRPDGSFAYAHLACGDNLIMVTQAREALADKPAAKLKSVKMPAKPGRFSGQACYLLVEDIEAHCARAKDAGAEIVRDIAPFEHGGRRYACRDPEGHVWTFGTYDPWHDKKHDTTAPPPARRQSPTVRHALAHRGGLAAAAVLTLVALAIPLWRMQAPTQATVATASEAVGGSTLQVAAVPAPEDAAINESVERIRNALTEEQTARRAAEASQRQTLTELETERAARQEAERAAERLRAELSAARATRAAAEQIAGDANDPITWETQAVPAASGNPPSMPIPAEPAAPVTAAMNVAPEPALETATPEVATPEAAAPEAAASESGPSAPDASPEASASPAGPSPAASSQADLAKAEPKARPVPSNPLLAEGRAAMANGDIEAARRHFRRLAAQGLPEAALALGSTYDPVSVERAGLASAQADRVQAKQWYRRAIELAQAATERRHGQ
jgi:uncharacterized glyoxalase superfamily protein PhnB